MTTLNIGIVGFGHVVVNTHLPILRALKDIKIKWVLDPDPKEVALLNHLNISRISSIDKLDDFPDTDIVLLTSPYGSRPPIFNSMKGIVKGIYCEKPFAKSVNEHIEITKDYPEYSFAIGYQRRSLGNINIIKNIIADNIFGPLKEVKCEYGYHNISSGSFHSDFKLSGGGILFESGVHWIDSMLYSINPLDIEKQTANVIYHDKLDVHTDASFSIKLEDDNEINCDIMISHLKATTDKITYIFEDVSVDLYLYNENDPPVVIPHKNNKKTYEVNNFLSEILPNTSFGQGAVFWKDYLDSFNNKKVSYTNASQSILTTKTIEQIYNS